LKGKHDLGRLLPGEEGGTIKGKKTKERKEGGGGEEKKRGERHLDKVNRSLVKNESQGPPGGGEW